jgi:hypothetical protein
MKHRLTNLNKEELEDIICEMLEESEHLGDTEHHKFKKFIDEKVYHISKEHAEHIVQNMKPYGQVFSMAQCKEIIPEHLEEYCYIKYYLCINMYANDSRNVAESLNIPLDMFCYHMAHSFINDIDAGEYKVEKYFTEITVM